MTTDAIITSVITSGVISSVFGIYANGRIKKLELHYSHKKFILDKRVKVYEEIGEFISVMESKYYRKDQKEPPQNDLNLLIAKLESILGNSIWIGGLCYSFLIALYHHIRLLITEDNSNRVVYLRGKILGAFHSLLPIYFSDLVDLDNIKQFTSEKLKSLIEDEEILGLLPEDPNEPVTLENGQKVKVSY